MFDVWPNFEASTLKITGSQKLPSFCGFPFCFTCLAFGMVEPQPHPVRDVKSGNYFAISAAFDMAQRL